MFCDPSGWDRGSATLTLPGRHSVGDRERVSPLPTASEVIYPAPPQTSKRRGYGKSGLCGILFSHRRLARPSAVLVRHENIPKGKKRVRKVTKTFRTLIRAQTFFHFSPQAQVVPRYVPVNLKSEIQPIGIVRPLERSLNRPKRTTLTTYAMQLLCLPTGK